MHFNLFTTCTSSGTIPAVEALNGKNLTEYVSHDAFLEYWTQTVEASRDHSTTAATLYTGVSFQAAQKIKSRLVQAGHTVDFYILSIGFGLIHPEEEIVPYNLSLMFDVLPRSPSMYRIVAGEKFQPELWWELINGAFRKDTNPISTVIGKDKKARNIFVISSTFLRMVSSDIWKAVQEFGPDSMAILGPSNTSQYVKASRKLVHSGAIVPTDRVKIDARIPGNKLDTPQRAGLFLVEQVLKDSKWDPHKQLEPIMYRSVGSVERQDIDIKAFVQEAKTKGDTKETVHRKLSERGYTVTAYLFDLLWDPDKKTEIVSQSNADAALEALKDIGFIEPEGEQESTELLVVFADALRKGGFVGSCFGSKEVITWAKAYCEKTNTKLPNKFASPNKLSHFIRTSGPSVGIQAVHNPKVQTASFQLVK